MIRVQSSLVNGKYVLGETLGQGGSARVFRARRSTDAREVAAKIIPIRETDDPLALLARYERLAKLEHQNILPILDVGLSNDVLYVISPLVADGSLRQRLQRGNLEPPLALELIRQIADALQHVHARGMLHLDVKPGNILLAARTTPLLSDFNVQQPGPGPTGRPRVRGTPAYMAPEQCTLCALGPPTDQYALAITSFELLAGRRPFSGSPPDEMLRRQVSETPPLPTSVSSRLPPRLDTVLLEALAKNPRQRYPDIGAFAVALTEAMAGARFVAPPAGADDAEQTVEVVTIEVRPTARHRV